jgi:hypothetical protein
MSKHLKFLQEFIPLIRRNFNLDTTFPKFKEYVIENVDEICEVADTRWLVSICETFADHGDFNERNIGFNISLIVNYERMARTYYYGSEPGKRPEVPQPLWDGIETIHERGDALINLEFRMRELLIDKNYIYLGKIFNTIINRMRKSDTIFGKLYR